MKKLVFLLLFGTMGALVAATPAAAQADCSRVVVFALPGVTWEDVDEVRPPALMSLVEDGAAGSMSVRTISSRTSYASGFATLGSGSRVDASRFSGAPSPEEEQVGRTGLFSEDVSVAGLSQLRADALEAGYDAVPGALANALGTLPITMVGNSDTGLPPAAPFGFGRWALLAAMDSEGMVASAATGLLVADTSAPWGVRTDPVRATKAIGVALEEDCGVTFVDPGDLARADELEIARGTPMPEERATALRAADALLADVVARLDQELDLLIVLSPTSPWLEEEAHLGVAAMWGRGVESGSSLQSASTRRSGIVTLPDVSPTVLEHLGLPPHPAMNGRPIFVVPGGDDLVEEAIALDRESIFVENMKTPITAGFVLVQVLIYAFAAGLIARRARTGEREFGRAARPIEFAMVCIVVFPISTYLVGAIDQHTIGSPLIYAVLLGITLFLATAIYLTFRSPLERLLAACALTLLVMFVDLVAGAGLQLNTVLGYSPVVAGRFAGLGNIAFAVMGIAGLITGALVAYRRRSAGRGLAIAATVFVAIVVFDGAPQLGSDVGGVLALVPSLGLTFLLLSGRKVSLKVAALGVLAGVLAVGAFLVLDLSRPPEERTHLARLYEDVRDRGFGVMTDTIERKVSANVRLFKTSLWTYFVPPALIAIALLMRRPRDLWERLDRSHPQVRAGLIGGLVLAGLGFAVNDSGIVIPAVVLSFLVPLAIMVHLEVDSETKGRRPA